MVEDGRRDRDDRLMRAESRRVARRGSRLECRERLVGDLTRRGETRVARLANPRRS